MAALFRLGPPKEVDKTVKATPLYLRAGLN